jgi:hypothetical protein
MCRLPFAVLPHLTHPGRTVPYRSSARSAASVRRDASTNALSARFCAAVSASHGLLVDKSPVKIGKESGYFADYVPGRIIVAGFGCNGCVASDESLPVTPWMLTVD